MAVLQEFHKYGLGMLYINCISIILGEKNGLVLHIRQGLGFEVSKQGQVRAVVLNQG